MLTGPGGIGKTRLALRVAGDVGDGFPDGVAFVRLAPVAQALGVRCYWPRTSRMGTGLPRTTSSAVLPSSLRRMLWP